MKNAGHQLLCNVLTKPSFNSYFFVLKENLAPHKTPVFCREGAIEQKKPSLCNSNLAICCDFDKRWLESPSNMGENLSLFSLEQAFPFVHPFSAPAASAVVGWGPRSLLQSWRSTIGPHGDKWNKCTFTPTANLETPINFRPRRDARVSRENPRMYRENTKVQTKTTEPGFLFSAISTSTVSICSLVFLSIGLEKSQRLL